jgi:SRSO17 transposase
LGTTPAAGLCRRRLRRDHRVRIGVEEREIPNIVQVQARTSAYLPQITPELRPWKGLGRPPVARYHAAPSSLRDLIFDRGSDAAVEVCWRHGSRGPMTSRFIALRVRPANIELRRRAADRQRAADSLAAGRVAAGRRRADPLLAVVAARRHAADRTVRLGKLRWRIEHDYRELKDVLGLDHFEGRSYRGWHHHVTLVSVAHGFLTLERLRPKTRAAA